MRGKNIHIALYTSILTGNHFSHSLSIFPLLFSHRRRDRCENESFDDTKNKSECVFIHLLYKYTDSNTKARKTEKLPSI